MLSFFFVRPSSDASESEVSLSLPLPFVESAKRTPSLGVGFGAGGCGEVAWRVTVATDALVLGVGEADVALEPEVTVGLVGEYGFGRRMFDSMRRGDGFAL